MTDLPVDGRSARAGRTRAKTIDALIGLLCEGRQPSAAEVAARAGVSARSIWVHFPTVEDLYEAAAARVTEIVVSHLSPIDPTAPVRDRIAELCRQRAGINEEVGPAIEAADRRRRDSPSLDVSRTGGHQASRAQLERVFAAELAPSSPAAAAQQVATIDALLSPSSWRLLRAEHGLDPDEAVAALATAIERLLLVAPPD